LLLVFFIAGDKPYLIAGFFAKLQAMPLRFTAVVKGERITRLESRDI
jgi:hypothetical protein